MSRHEHGHDQADLGVPARGCWRSWTCGPGRAVRSERYDARM